jgi:hypothetical protein
VLKEYHNVRQEARQGRRRWFEDDQFDFVVWYDQKGAVAGFQICYRTGPNLEHALSWRAQSGFVHDRVDEGDDSPLKNMTPILVPDGDVPWALLATEFARRSAELEEDLRTLVLDRLAARS